MVFNATFNNISVISWRSVLLVEETGGPGENLGSQDFETISHFCETFFFLIMNKKEYNELNLIISYVSLWLSNGD